MGLTRCESCRPVADIWRVLAIQRFEMAGVEVDGAKSGAIDIESCHLDIGVGDYRATGAGRLAL
jgi:hypothetical protein